MRTKQLQDQKVKRILLYWDYLGKMRIDPQASIELVKYVFGISERWTERIIKTRSLAEPELVEIDLEHFDLELKLIEGYAQKLLKLGKQQRPEIKQSQSKFFE